MTCWYHTDLPHALVEQVTRRWAGEITPEPGVYCMETTGHGGRPHRGCLLSLAYSAVWAEWCTGRAPRLVELPDCPSLSEDGADGCALYEDHDGLHTWQGRDC
ncbi:hypothetical protein [Streptomyces fradiae]|uniref:hypothetical protein n=1 Tax=Streptomyces fradiae TaxID=1906 RepID=UPI002942A437|nr:hypothetical protein [Streptomyces fradiae]WOI62895.1 hypothetical protein RYQ63_25095 [Streptomyces fradiae]